MGEEYRKQWTWVPGMSETFILSLSDPDDVRYEPEIALCLKLSGSNACNVEQCC